MRLGADPEIFLIDLNVGKHIAINGFINAGKHDPLQIPDAPEGFTLQEDNVALEYGIPPASSSEEFQRHIRYVMERSREWLPKNLDFSKLSCTVFEDDQLQHPLSMVFGCEPDYCAYTKKANPAPRPPHRGMRSAGGHIHVETQEDPMEVVKAMDKYLGIPSLLMDNGEERKKLYGKAGACRVKSYGPEYRTLSNFWVMEDKLVDWTWRNTERALKNLGSDKNTLVIQKCIDTNDKKLACELVKEYDLEVI